MESKQIASLTSTSSSTSTSTPLRKGALESPQRSPELDKIGSKLNRPVYGDELIFDARECMHVVLKAFNELCALRCVPQDVEGELKEKIEFIAREVKVIEEGIGLNLQQEESLKDLVYKLLHAVMQFAPGRNLISFKTHTRTHTHSVSLFFFPFSLTNNSI